MPRILLYGVLDGERSHTIAFTEQCADHYTTNTINIFVKTYYSQTPAGLDFQLSLSDDGVCCIIVYDTYDCELVMRYFTNVNRALRFINNL